MNFFTLHIFRLLIATSKLKKTAGLTTQPTSMYETMQNFCPFILRILIFMISNITYLIIATSTAKETGGLTTQPTGRFTILKLYYC
jgi:hypothetical protein